MKPLERKPTMKQIRVKVGILRACRPTPALLETIREAIENCDHRVGGVDVKVVRVPVPKEKERVPMPPVMEDSRNG